MATIADVMQMADKDKIAEITVRLDEIGDPEWDEKKKEHKQECKVSDSTGSCDLSRVYKEGKPPFTKVGVTVTIKAYKNKDYGLTGLYANHWDGDYKSSHGIRMTNTAAISVVDGAPKQADSTQHEPARRPQTATNPPNNGERDGGREIFFAMCRLMAEGTNEAAKTFAVCDSASADALIEAAEKIAVAAAIHLQRTGTPLDPVKAIQTEETVDDKREKFSPEQKIEACPDCTFAPCECEQGSTEPPEAFVAPDDDPSGDPPF